LSLPSERWVIVLICRLVEDQDPGTVGGQEVVTAGEAEAREEEAETEEVEARREGAPKKLKKEAIVWKRGAKAKVWTMEKMETLLKVRKKNIKMETRLLTLLMKIQMILK